MRQFDRASFPAEVLRDRSEGISVVFPALDEEPTVGQVAGIACELREEGLIDEVVVVDGGSADGTREVARQAGATVVTGDSAFPELGPLCGKGDSMWRGLAATSGDIVVFFDADLESFDRSYLVGLAAPLVAHPSIKFVKSSFQRASATSDEEEEAGRVTQTTAGPLIATFFPRLSRFRQPLSGQVAGRRAVLEAVPFLTGYAVDVGLMIALDRMLEGDEIAEVDLGELVSKHQDLLDLSPMAYEVLLGVLGELERDGLVSDIDPPATISPFGDPALMRTVDVGERPPLSSLTKRSPG